MRREFSANVSHELKTPITTISGYAELLMRGVAPAEDVPRISELIYLESQRLISLIDDIIRLSRLDEGAHETPLEPVELLAAANSCAERLQAKAMECGVTITVEGTEQTINGSEQLVGEMLYNLCDNAIKYNRPGGSVRVFVGESGGFPCFSVTDDGIGIAPEHMGRIFERFYRVDKSRSKATGGTGLGLSIVKHAAAWHGARVKAESEPDKGTRIAIIFDGKGAE